MKAISASRRPRAASAALMALFAACGDEGTGPTNAAPTAAFTVQCGPLHCTFTNGSSDADGTLVAFNWNFGDDSPRAETRDAVHTYLAPGGRFTVTLDVTDDAGETATTSRQVDVSEANVAPIAGFTVSCAELTCTFSDGSYDLNTVGSVVSYAWDFGDGETSIEQSPKHSYADAALYTVTLTVTDDLGNTGTVSRGVTVSRRAPAEFPPVPHGALTYFRVSASRYGSQSRYVLYADSTFALQYVATSYGFFEYTGRYARVEASMNLDFDANQPRWQATATIEDDSLVVSYNLDMALSDFEDGVYRLVPRRAGQASR